MGAGSQHLPLPVSWRCVLQRWEGGWRSSSQATRPLSRPRARRRGRGQSGTDVHSISNGLSGHLQRSTEDESPSQALACFGDRTRMTNAITPMFSHLTPSGSKWWYVFGSATLFAFLLQIVTGIALSTVYVPSANSAYASLTYISTAATLGPVLRGMHYFGSSAMVLFVGIVADTQVESKYARLTRSRLATYQARCLRARIKRSTRRNDPLRLRRPLLKFALGSGGNRAKHQGLGQFVRQGGFRR